MTGEKASERSCAFTILVFQSYNGIGDHCSLDTSLLVSSKASQRQRQGKVSQRGESLIFCARLSHRKEATLVLQKVETPF